MLHAVTDLLFAVAALLAIGTIAATLREGWPRIAAALRGRPLATGAPPSAMRGTARGGHRLTLPPHPAAVRRVDAIAA